VELASLLLVASSAVLIWQAPHQVPPQRRSTGIFIFRISLQLVLAGGLFLGAAWAWWGAVVTSGAAILMTAVAAMMFVLAGVVRESRFHFLLHTAVSELAFNSIILVLLLAAR
jgi:hypothetical protein